MVPSTDTAQGLRQSELPFRVVLASRAHERVADQIVYFLRAGLLEPGDRLPTIEILADLTAVSKPVIGEAIRLLRMHGLLATKRGVQGGISVVSSDVPPELLRLFSGWPQATLTELVEARRPIESELAQLAGERATEAEIDRIGESLTQLLESYDRGREGDFLRYDHLFHYQIGLAAKSEKLALFQHRILNEIAAILSDYGLFHSDLDLVVSTHQAILQAIRDRNPDAIATAVDSHWRTSSGAFADVQELDSGGESA